MIASRGVTLLRSRLTGDHWGLTTQQLLAEVSRIGSLGCSPRSCCGHKTWLATLPVPGCDTPKINSQCARWEHDHSRSNAMGVDPDSRENNACQGGSQC